MCKNSDEISQLNVSISSLASSQPDVVIVIVVATIEMPIQGGKGREEMRNFTRLNYY